MQLGSEPQKEQLRKHYGVIVVALIIMITLFPLWFYWYGFGIASSGVPETLRGQLMMWLGWAILIFIFLFIPLWIAVWQTRKINALPSNALRKRKGRKVIALYVFALFLLWFFVIFSSALEKLRWQREFDEIIQSGDAARFDEFVSGEKGRELPRDKPRDDETLN